MAFAYYTNLSPIYIKDFSNKVIFKEGKKYRTYLFKILEIYKYFPIDVLLHSLLRSYTTIV